MKEVKGKITKEGNAYEEKRKTRRTENSGITEKVEEK